MRRQRTQHDELREVALRLQRDARDVQEYVGELKSAGMVWTSTRVQITAARLYALAREAVDVLDQYDAATSARHETALRLMVLRAAGAGTPITDYLTPYP